MADQKLKAGIISRRVYTNDVPMADVSIPPKFLKMQFNDLERHAKCQISKLEEEYTYEVVPEDILKLCPPLVDISVFKRPEEIEFDPLDALLLEDDFGNQQSSKRSQQHKRIVPWMRKTEYISTEFNRFGVTQEKSENKIGYNIKKKYGKSDSLYRDAESQIRAIEKIFEKTNRPVKRHYSKKDVYPVEEMYILPDEEEWKHSYAQVIFDGDPLPHIKDNEKILEKSIIKGIADENNQQFVAYFVPTAETLEKMQEEHGEDEEVEYKCDLAREYNWTITTKASKGSSLDLYFFAERDGVVYYNEMDTKIKLARRAKNVGGVSREGSFMIYTYRDLTPAEMKTMETRSRRLYDEYKTGEKVPLDPLEEEVEEEEEEEQQEEAEEEPEEPKKPEKSVFEEDSSSEDEKKENSSDSEEEKSETEAKKPEKSKSTSDSESEQEEGSAKSSSESSSSDND
ncbi:unnamed protein product [Bursaphelenchus xylophilus]|uniref:RNA polymerase II-associated factor 1 homolog n=1 Tax=Bursaphelenchus xylophilus TaxID=6326 RepID=A0A1I7S1V3_BURXY|nr:unnamed protein product [Bursaphelenchus xylophilus]CAG9089991.1 unnamed protein product [Bursaphelenchus xylophilus]